MIARIKKAKEPTKRGRGRPITTGKGTPVFVRMQPEMLEAVDRWRGDKVTRSEAIRQLVHWAIFAPTITPKAK